MTVERTHTFRWREWRLLAPTSIRWRMAARHADRAEALEDRAERLRVAGMTERPDPATLAIRAYLRALRWWPLRSATDLPWPEDVGSHPADEALYPEGFPEEYLPCIMCGDPIRARMVSETTGGLYCSACES